MTIRFMPNWKTAAAGAAIALTSMMLAPNAQAAAHHRAHRAYDRMEAPGVRDSYDYAPTQGPVVVERSPEWGYDAYAYDPNDPSLPPFPDYCPYNTCRR